MHWNEKEILLTGGTGSLGKALTDLLLTQYQPHGIRIFSRDELKQFEMRNDINKRFPDAQVSFLIGDIRDRKRLELACKGVHIIVHAAALKQVGAGEDNPLETIQTNVIGSQNVLYAALENKVEKVIGISSDKACYPINLYGATKMCMEKLFIQGNAYSGGRPPRFSICRYGNVVGSRGSVIPLFKEQAKTGKIMITDYQATRFWITLPQVAQFIIDRTEYMKGEEIFVPKMPSCSVFDIAKAVTPYAEFEVTSLTIGEKRHETLVTEEEAERSLDSIDHFVIFNEKMPPAGRGYKYDSFTNPWKLSEEEIKEMI